MEDNLCTYFKQKYVFVGGKGGVGKTSTSCSLALTLSERYGLRVLLVSTDPAHNLRDAFGQKFEGTPTQVEGAPRLFCIELSQEDTSSFAAEIFGSLSPVLASFPGIDEATTLHFLMNSPAVQEFDKVVFDTAPTGHTLRFLGLPEVLDKGLEKVLEAEDSFLGLFGAAKAFLPALFAPKSDGKKTLAGELSSLGEKSTFEQLSTLKESVLQIRKTFADPLATTFVCVAIPEFLALYETERLFIELKKAKVACGLIVLNQILTSEGCAFCKKRKEIHSNFVHQFEVLYKEETLLLKLPVVDWEVRGLANLRRFGALLDDEISAKKLD